MLRFLGTLLKWSVFLFLFLLKSIFTLLLLVVLLIGGINLYVQYSTEAQILSHEEALALQDCQCILVLGAGVLSPTQPGAMVQARLDEAVALYQDGAAPKLLMSGDHRTADYNEVGTMKYYAVACGVPSEDIFLDHLGLSTYESMYRAKALFGCEEIIVVTQEYHLPRALYIGEALGITVYGVACQTPPDDKQEWREVREVFARIKDVVNCFSLPVPATIPSSITPISLDGNGDATNEPLPSSK